jgi:hypothetical protein
MEVDVRVVLKTIICGLFLAMAVPAAAQSELQLRQAFEGRYVTVRMDMPASQRGVDVYPERDPSVDFQSYSARLREFGIALREGTRVMVTAVRVKKKNIEFQLAGGGYGVFGDDTGSVYVPSADKTRREKDLEKRIKDERDPDRRRRMQRELDDLRDDRHRENRDRESEKRDLEAQKQGEIASKRLDAGSRFNLWFPDERLTSGAPTPSELRHLLSTVVFFDGDDARPRGGDARRSAYTPPPPPPEPEPGPGIADLRRGMSTDEVHDLFGKPTRVKPGKQGELTTLTEWYEQGDRVTEVLYVSGSVIRFSTSSK